MKQLFFVLSMFCLSVSMMGQTTAERSVRDSLFNDSEFRGIVADIMYEIAIDVVANDTSTYEISVRPYFDRYLTTPTDSRDFFVDMIALSVLNNSQSVINLNGVQSVEIQVEFILKTLKIWQGPVNAYMRQKQGVFAFPNADLDDIIQRLEALEGQ